MKLIKMFVLIIIILFLVYFLTLNNSNATVNLLTAQYYTVVNIIMLVSFGVGLIVGFLLATTSVISAKNNARVLRTKNKKLVDELNQLRNVNVDEDALVPEINSEV